MVADWFPSWSQRHLKRFGVAYDVEYTLDWLRVFEQTGVTEQEAESASLDLLANNPPSYKRQHLAAIMTWIKNRRGTNGAQKEFDHCELCSGSGRVVVPWTIDEYRRWHHTNAVYCRCQLGRWYEEKHRDLYGKITTNIDRYEEMIPDWKVLMNEGKTKAVER